MRFAYVEGRIAMELNRRFVAFVQGFALLLASGCMVEATESAEETAAGGEKVAEEVGSASAALNDAFTTPNITLANNAAIANGGNRVFVVWLAHNATGRQVVGQMFSLTNGAPIGPSRIYTNTNHEKDAVSVAYNGLNGFFIVYEDRFSAEDHDLLGLRIDQNGNLTGSSIVNFSGAFDNSPSVTWVPSAGKWLVTYQHTVFTPTSTNGLEAVYVDAVGTAAPPVMILPTGAGFIVHPKAVFSPMAGGRIMYAWGHADTVKFAFGLASTLGIGDIFALPKPAGHHFYGPRIALNPNNNQIGMAYRDETPGVSQVGRLRIFPNGCQALACALAEQPTQLPGPASSANSLGIAALGSGFMLFGEQQGAGLPNNDAVRSVFVNAVGIVGSSFNTGVSGCTTALSSSPFIFGATSTPTASLATVLVRPNCNNANKITATHWTTGFVSSRFNVSDP